MKAEYNKIGDKSFYITVKFKDETILTLWAGSDRSANTVCDNFNSALSSHVQSELSKTNAGYWRKMYELSRNIIHKLNIGQTYEYMPEAVELEAMEDQSEPPSELSAKIEQLKKEFTDKKIREL